MDATHCGRRSWAGEEMTSSMAATSTAMTMLFLLGPRMVCITSGGWGREQRCLMGGQGMQD